MADDINMYDMSVVRYLSNGSQSAFHDDIWHQQHHLQSLSQTVTL